MYNTIETTRALPEIDPGLLAAADCADIDPMTLARLDIGLFRCLCKLRTSRQRICSALRLSYAEYDYIAKLLKTP